jgi:hypothetical protein
MHPLLRSFYTKPLVLYLVFALLMISTISGPAEAMLLPAAQDDGAVSASSLPFDRAADLKRIQTTLESKTLQQKLMDYGLSPEAAMAKVNSLSNEQVHQLASNMDSVQAGGDGIVGAVVGLLIIALLAVLLIYLLEGRIEVKRK